MHRKGEQEHDRGKHCHPDELHQLCGFAGFVRD
jgi:hypothetical protein